MACQFVNLALPGCLLPDLGRPDGPFAAVVEGHPPVEGEREHLVAFGARRASRFAALPLAARFAGALGGAGSPAVISS